MITHKNDTFSIWYDTKTRSILFITKIVGLPNDAFYMMMNNVMRKLYENDGA